MRVDAAVFDPQPLVYCDPAGRRKAVEIVVNFSLENAEAVNQPGSVSTESR
jgi:hypothetical protein